MTRAAQGPTALRPGAGGGGIVAFRTLLLLSSASLPSALASSGSSWETNICAQALTTAYGLGLTFAPGNETYFEALCLNPLQLTSIYAAALTYCPLPGYQPHHHLQSSPSSDGNDDEEDGKWADDDHPLTLTPAALDRILSPVIAHLDGSCIPYFSGVPAVRPSALDPSLRRYLTDIDRDDDDDDDVPPPPPPPRVVDLHEVPRSEILAEPVLLSRNWLDLASRSAGAWELTEWARNLYSLLTYLFWALVVGGKAADEWIWGVYRARGRRGKGMMVAATTGGRRRRRRSHGGGGGDDGGGRGLLEGAIEQEQEKKTLDAKDIPVRAHRWADRNLAVPQAFRLDHSRNWLWSAVPTRLEAIIVAAYWVFSIVTCCITYDVFEGNLNFGDPASQWWRYIADRTGVLSYANLVLLWLFGCRNNILIWATGWQFKHFNLFHRHVARVATLQAVVHSVAYTVLYFRNGNADSYFINLSVPWFFMGIVGTVLMCFLVFFSIMWFRTHYYEPFLIFHIAASIVVIVGLFVHTTIFHGAYDIYLWPPTILWILDRVIRIARVAYCNLHISFHYPFFEYSLTEVQYIPGADILEIRMNLPGTRIQPSPGQFYYLSQPLSWTGYENHPFSLVSYGRVDDISRALLDNQNDHNDGESSEDEPLLRRSHGSHSTSSNHHTNTSAAAVTAARRASTPRTRLVFWARPYLGWTRKLTNETKAARGGTTSSLLSTTILAEGPYGRREHVWDYDRILMIAGGTGIAAMAPYLLEYAGHDDKARQQQQRRRRRGSQEEQTPTSGGGEEQKTQFKEHGRRMRTHAIDLVWTARQDCFIQYVTEGQLAHVLARPDVAARFYTTRPPSSAKSEPQQPGDDEGGCLLGNGNGNGNGHSAAGGDHRDYDAEREEEEDDGDDDDDDDDDSGRGGGCALRDGGGVIHAQRPDLEAAIAEAALEARDTSCSLAVMVCGPAGMASSARAATHAAMTAHADAVVMEYFEETFG